MRQGSRGRIMKRGVIVVAAIVALIAVLALWMVVGMTRTGFSTHGDATMMEKRIARMMRGMAVPAELKNARNPMPMSPMVLPNARAHFADHCAVCHGNDGKGNTPIGENLFPKAPDMTLEATQSLTDGELFAIIENGVRLTGMPGWGDGTAASGKGSWELVHFIRHLPNLTREEIEEMERLNPKPPAEWARIQAEEAFLSGGDPPPPPAGGHQH